MDESRDGGTQAEAGVGRHVHSSGMETSACLCADWRGLMREAGTYSTREGPARRRGLGLGHAMCEWAVGQVGGAGRDAPRSAPPPPTEHEHHLENTCYRSSAPPPNTPAAWNPAFSSHPEVSPEHLEV